MSELISKAKLAVLTWWLVIAYFLLFSANSLAGAVIATFHNDPAHSALVTWCAILNLWSTAMLAFITQSVGKIKQYVNGEKPTTKNEP
jgi:hypothetical protein